MRIGLRPSRGDRLVVVSRLEDDDRRRVGHYGVPTAKDLEDAPEWKDDLRNVRMFDRARFAAFCRAGNVPRAK